uniref:Uncharacterized protein n=1 Tax=Eutreptiella gymnastica TaxID=73025 RepID=A0A7S4C786_9EUGL
MAFIIAQQVAYTAEQTRCFHRCTVCISQDAFHCALQTLSQHHLRQCPLASRQLSQIDTTGPLPLLPEQLPPSIYNSTMPTYILLQASRHSHNTSTPTDAQQHSTLFLFFHELDCLHQSY